jgi:nucleotide-binding universal stress UspA family protein
MELSLIHALPNVDAAREKEAYGKMIGICEQVGMRADLIVQTGSVTRVVQRIARRDQSDLVVIGRGGNGDARNSLGVHTYWLAGVSPCPVLACSREAVSRSSFWTEWQQPEAVMTGSGARL